MSAPPADAIAAHVDAALALGNYSLPPGARERVLEQFERIAAIAAVLDTVPLAAEDEIAPVFRPQGPQ